MLSLSQISTSQILENIYFYAFVSLCCLFMTNFYYVMRPQSIYTFFQMFFADRDFFQTVSVSMFSKSLFSNGFRVYVFIFKPFLPTRIIMGRPENQSLIDISLIQPRTVRQTRHGGQYCFSKQPWV